MPAIPLPNRMSPGCADTSKDNPRKPIVPKNGSLRTAVFLMPETLITKRLPNPKCRSGALAPVARRTVGFAIYRARNERQDLKRYHSAEKSVRTERGSECCWLSQPCL